MNFFQLFFILGIILNGQTTENIVLLSIRSFESNNWSIFNSQTSSRWRATLPSAGLYYSLELGYL